MTDAPRPKKPGFLPRLKAINQYFRKNPVSASWTADGSAIALYTLITEAVPNFYANLKTFFSI